MYDVTAIGELLIDFASISLDRDGYPTLKAQPGGAPANYLAALAAYGMKTAMLAKVGTDVFGKLLIESIKKSGVETKGIVKDDSVFTTLAFVTHDESGNRYFSFARKPGADTCLRINEIDLSLIEESKVFHFGTLSLTDEPVRMSTQKAVTHAKEHRCLITFDPNLRLPLWVSAEAAKEQILWGMKQADIVKISDEEIEFLWGLDEYEGAKKLLDEYGVSLAMVTLGPKGCYLLNRKGNVSVACPPVKTIDTTGAGDIFGGSAVSRILKLGKHPEELTEDELHGVATFATVAASLSTQKMGGIPSVPSEEEVLAIIETIT
jgi:sugar/nucleoside kinase (ribokinase family)